MGKQGLCVNLKDPRGLEMMHKLTDTADVFVENYRPGALESSASAMRSCASAIRSSCTARFRPTATRAPIRARPASA